MTTEPLLRHLQDAALWLCAVAMAIVLAIVW